MEDMEQVIYGDMVLVLPDPVETKTQAGIIIPDTAKDAPNRGTVIEAGPGPSIYGPMKSKPGMIVLYRKHGGTPINLDGTNYLLMKEDNILIGWQKITTNATT